MNTDRKLQWLVGVLAGVAVVSLATGCQNDSAEVIAHGEEFPAANAVRPVNEFITMQAARGARTDATIRKYHFDGADLNSLGEERIDLILKSGESTSPLVLYLDLPEDDAMTADRHQSLVAYLKDRGLTQQQLVIKPGANPDSHSLVAPLLAGAGGPPPAVGGAPGAGAAPSGH